MTAEGSPARDRRATGLYRFVASVTVFAGVVVGFAGVGLVDGSFPAWRVAAGVVAVAFVQGRSTLLRFRRSRTEVQYHDDVLFPFLLVFLGPAGAVVSTALGTLGANLIVGRAIVKAVYNVAQFTLAAGVGAGTLWFFESTWTDEFRPFGVLLGSMIFTAAGVLLFARLQHHLGGEPWWSVVRESLGDDAKRYSAEVLLGVLAAFAVETRPVSAPIAVVAVLVVLETHRRWFWMARDRERLEDMLSAATSLHGAATVQQVQEALVDAIRMMTGAETEFSSHPVRSGPGLELELDTGGEQPQTAVVSRLDPLDATEVVIVESLARVAEVSMRVAALVELYADQSEELAELIAEREAFLTATAHQLRTPMTAVLGFGHLIEEAATSPDLAEMAGYVVREASEMSNALDNLLIASRSITNSLLVATSHIDVGTEARRVAAEIDSRRSIVVSGEARAVGDPVRVRQVLRNLIRNALEHGGGHVTVAVGARGGQAHVDVIDDGPGVSEERVENLFLAFTRNNGVDGRPGSTGLGLHAARQLARLMSGDITYRRGAGQTIFRFDLPTPPQSTPSHSEAAWATTSERA